MKAGRELDALIAEKVMGLKIFPDMREKYVDGNKIYTIPHYSTSIADAWLVVDKIKEKEEAWHQFDLLADCYYLTQITPELICSMSLKAIGVEVE